MNQDNSSATHGVHLMAKPVGPVCNLDCSYCFYLEKEALYPPRERFSMSDEVLRAYIERNIRSEPSPEVLFTWQGGEPMLRGLDFYKQAWAWQQELAGGKTIRNALQTNGVLLNDEWCTFLAEAGFMVGLSIDGPAELHDAGRRDKQGRGTFDQVLQALKLLQQYRIETNVLVTVSATVAQQPLAVYRFLKQQGVTHIQFNPVVERAPAGGDVSRGLSFAEPPRLGRVSLSQPALAVTPDSVGSEAYGQFLTAIFDEWVRQDVGSVYVMNFEWALAAWLQLPATVCLFAENCGQALIVEHDGNVYACDHYMYPDYRLGNIAEDDPRTLAALPQQQAFGQAKSASLPAYCRSCEYLTACRGECPKNRFAFAPDGEAGLNYLCAGYKHYFRHIAPAMNAMVKLISHDLPASMVMDAFKGPLVVKLPQG